MYNCARAREDFEMENEKDMFSGFGLFRGGIVHFQRKKSDFCTKRGWDCAFLEEKRDFCTKRGRDCAFSEGKRDFCTKWS